MKRQRSGQIFFYYYCFILFIFLFFCVFFSSQGSTLIIGGALFALATLQEDHGLRSFCWIYGFGLGSYNYVLKTWTYEKTRAKNFSRAWSFVQCAQGLGCMFGVPATGKKKYGHIYVSSWSKWPVPKQGSRNKKKSFYFFGLSFFCLLGYMNIYVGWRTGYFLSAASVFFSSVIILCCGMRRRRVMRNKSGTSSMKT